MLACAGFGNHAGLAHALGQHGLADHVVDLVRAGVVQVFTFEKDLCAAHFAAGTGRVVDGRRAPHEMLEFVLKFRQELRIVLVAGIGLAQFLDGVRQGFADKTAPIGAKVPGGVRLLIRAHGDSLQVVHRPHARRQRSVGFFRRP